MSRKKKVRVPKQEKHKYSSQDIVFSSGWNTSDYRLADKQRQIDRDLRKENNAQSVGILLDLVESNNIKSFSKFIKIVYSSYSEFAPIALQYHTFFRDYIRSFSEQKLQEDIEKSYKEYKELEFKYQCKFEEFQAEMQEKLSFRESQISDLEHFIDTLIKPPDKVQELKEIHDDWEDFETVANSFDLSEFDLIPF